VGLLHPGERRSGPTERSHVSLLPTHSDLNG
jgi:hypothetical protein